LPPRAPRRARTSTRGARPASSETKTQNANRQSCVSSSDHFSPLRSRPWWASA
jgi:hypothetical protein